MNVELRDRPPSSGSWPICAAVRFIISRSGMAIVLYLYAIESATPAGSLLCGDRAPMHCTSVGKAILAGCLG